MNLKNSLCIIMCIFIFLLSGCSDKPEDANDFYDSDLTPTQVGMSTFLGKEYTASSTLSSDIDSYQVQIYDTVFTFPFYYDELIADGWTLGEYEDPNEEIGSYKESIIIFQKGYLSVSFKVYNPDFTIHTADDCVISGFVDADIDSDYDYLPKPVFIPGGYQLGVSKMNEIISSYRKPDWENKTEYSTTFFEYKTDNAYVSVMVSFDENDVLDSYNLDKPIKPEGYKVSSTESVANDYKTPTQMGNKIIDLTVRFMGDLYTLPAPVSAFIDYGWQIVGDSPTVSGRYVEHIDLKRGKDTISVSIFNPYEVGVTAEDAFVEDLSSSDAPHYYKDGFDVSGGLNMDMTENELLDIIKKSGLSYIPPEQNYSSYGIIIDDSLNQYVSVRMESNKVMYISVDTDVRVLYK